MLQWELNDLHVQSLTKYSGMLTTAGEERKEPHHRPPRWCGGESLRLLSPSTLFLLLGHLPLPHALTLTPLFLFPSTSRRSYPVPA